MDKFNQSIKELKKSSRSYSSQGQDVAEAAIALLRESQGETVCCTESQTCRDDDDYNDESASDDSSLDEITIIQGKSELRKTLERLNATADRFGESIPALGGVPLTTPRTLPLPMRSTTIEEMHNSGYPIPGCGIQAGSMLYKTILEPAEFDISQSKERRKEARKKKKKLDERKAILAEQMLIDMVTKYVDAGVCAGPCAAMAAHKCVPAMDDACTGGCEDEESDDSDEMEDECVGTCVDYEEEEPLLLSEVCPDECAGDDAAEDDCRSECPLQDEGAMKPDEDDDDDECKVVPHEAGRGCVQSCKEGGAPCTETAE